MRVAFVSLFTPEHGTTPARARTRRVARGLAERGHDVIWLCARWWGGDVERFESDGFTYRAVVPDPSPTAFVARLPTALRRADPAVVHAVNSPPTPTLAATVARRLRGPPVLVDWWRDHPADSRRGYRLLARDADAITTPSRTTKTRVREHGATGDAVRVVPESIDTELIADAAIDDRFDAVYSRRLDRHANVETFLLALAEIRGRDWTAAVIGDGPERERIESTARDLRIADRVEFLGNLPLDERVPIFKGTHAFAQTATWETFASELLLALACGCVGLVEYQADSSAHELVEGRTRGRLVTSPAELADELVAVGELDRRTTEPEFDSYDHDAVLDRYVDLYTELAGK
ncbi:glycosyltransferase involved in cell wall biosynthesis [Halorubrum alkaliphilum]|uniref:Glycosyltransferase involved in cell wall biosynthesis n=1 Tax=Halorubrum alkaliphilum TaxID=261290 RepID=A0A8T4GCH8_9EURY|nr:glycosyltransferase [Halorubrum alkaliphilum]MBP1921350.1 glycosyltransferase involved in cell wall biosynthesis [Halorubrum alkaliphilum]